MPRGMTLRGVAAAALFCLGCLPDVPHENVDADPQATDGSVPPADTSTAEAISDADPPELTDTGVVDARPTTDEDTSTSLEVSAVDVPEVAETAAVDSRPTTNEDTTTSDDMSDADPSETAETAVVDSGPTTNECGGRRAAASGFCHSAQPVELPWDFMLLSSVCGLADLSATCPALDAVRVIGVYETDVPGWLDVWAMIVGPAGGANGTIPYVFDPCAESITCEATERVHMVPGGHYAIALRGCNGPASGWWTETGFCDAYEVTMMFTAE